MKHILCTLLYALSLGAVQAQSSGHKAAAVIAAYMDASGGYKSIDSLFKAMYRRTTVRKAINDNPRSALWRRVPLLSLREEYSRRSGAFVTITTDLTTGNTSYLGLTQDHAWQWDSTGELRIDTTFLFESLWQDIGENNGLYDPLNLHPSCQDEPARWLREDFEAGRAYDVIALGGYGHEYWFDQNTKLLAKVVTSGGTFHHYFKEYHKVQGVWVAHEMISVKNGALAIEEKIDSIRFLPEIDDEVLAAATYMIAGRDKDDD